MEINRALTQISEIHDQIAKAETYRGYRAVPVALSGLLAILAATLQPGLVGSEPSIRVVAFWTATALICCLVAGVGIIYHYFIEEGVLLRRRTRTVVGQFLPPLAAGVIVTLAAARIGREVILLLPGLWAMLFGLGVFASRPYLPRATGWVGLYYFLAGGLLLALSGDGESFHQWSMGMTFGPGQILAGIVLYRDQERNGAR